MAAPFPSLKMRSPLFLLLALSSITHSARGELSSGCNPLPEPSLVNQFLLTNHSDLRNPAFGESVNGLTAEEGLRFPRQLQVVKCHSFGNLSTGNSSFDFYQVESPSQVCKAPPPLEFDLSPNVRSEMKGPGGLLFLAFLASVIITGLTTWAIVFSLGAFLVRSIGRLVCWLSGKLCVSPEAEANMNNTSLVIQESFGAAFYVQTNGVWSLDKNAKRAADPLSQTHDVATWDTDFGGGLNRFLNDSGTGLNLTLCATKTMTFYVSCPVRCAGLGEPYGNRAPGKAQLKVCPDYFERTPVKMALIENVCDGVAGAVAVLLTFWCCRCCLRKKRVN
ncbi:hypothetical protein KFL_002080170 [Klebsormidium nitens]|uniref:Uncharacterized protein n=1 Tax=Klebsormidium nitens TaxID=105231 RepID=A0A1Y1I1P9_KLENI|nr:hypothetical protein KFL_002080170 [Klebsormidium nitens]|eukprot:GAQ84840.1 hypothetical protein KFL_002080170 [Klebsormidium nitens]